MFVMALICFVTLFTGCEDVPEKGIYKEGTYIGSSEYEYADVHFVTTAVVYINDLGMIKSVFVDSTYIDGSSATTRKVHKNTNAIDETGEISSISWDKQVDLIEKAIIKEQDLNFIKWSNEEKTLTDSIDGVTIPIQDIYNAVSNALNQAK